MKCNVCKHNCDLIEGSIGNCHARSFSGGNTVELGYGYISSCEMVPIEQLPLSEYKKGSNVLTIGAYGCNMKCPYCNTYHISQQGPDYSGGLILTPEQIATKAMSEKAYGNIGICYSGNEPMVGYEYVRDCSRYTKQLGMDSILMTNGFTDETITKEIYPMMNAINISIKTMRKSLYKKWGGDRDCVLRNIEIARECTHLELSIVIVPGANDTKKEMDTLATWIAKLDADIPLHILKFIPDYKMKDTWVTSDRLISELEEVARGSLNHVSTRTRW